ncbi:hypothetical protein [Streptomyces sp. NPDC048638]|uniref:hypothetical protein n=1 Tax=Streptomyces sp. NPDC048638 TaxID=3365580 RepID=UPI003721254B
MARTASRRAAPGPERTAATVWFGQVPADLLRTLVRAHGGENAHQYPSAAGREEAYA